MNDSNNAGKELTANDYRDPDFAELQVLSDYVTQHSIPQNMTVSQVQNVVRILIDLMNLTIYNLNLLRNLAGDGDYELADEERSRIENV